MQLWMLSMVAVFMVDASALVLGEIQVVSHLGQSLSARIALDELSGTDALQLKARLASAEDYQKLGLQYPDGHKFSFQLVNEAGAQPFIRVFTRQPIDDPFVNLLVDIATQSGRLIKAYTFLLDPLPDFSASVEEAQQASPGAVSEPAGSARQEITVKPVARRKRHRAGKIPVSLVQNGRHHMKLAMSLSISRYDPSASVDTDALQEELIVKEKLLNDLKLQISEMEGMIKALNDKHALADHTASGVAGDNGMTGTTVSEPASEVVVSAPVSKESIRPKIVPAVQPRVKPAAELNWQYSAMVLIALLSGVLGLLRYRKRRQDDQTGMFDDLPEEAVVVEIKKPFHEQPPAVQPLAASEEKFAEPMFSADPAPLKFEETELPSGELQAAPCSERRSEPSVPPEYAILMEANRHLRAGDEMLAEKALLRAIKVNPKNTYGYLALLKIYQQHADTAGFAKTAKKLKETGDEITFEEAAAMGRELDPENPLYSSGMPG